MSEAEQSAGTLEAAAEKLKNIQRRIPRTRGQ
jgi:hypothetical protein